MYHDFYEFLQSLSYIAIRKNYKLVLYEARLNSINESLENWKFRIFDSENGRNFKIS